MKRGLSYAGVGFLAVFVALNAAHAADDALSQQAKACDDNVAYYRSKIDGVVAWSNVFMVSGAIIAAIGSAFAGVLTKDAHRKAAAVLGALGAVITVLPKTLPDKEALQAHLSAAEKHRVLGEKVRNQLGFAQPGESIVEAQKYASARFTDCASVDPPAAAPELPEPAPQQAVLATLNANQPAAAPTAAAAPAAASASASGKPIVLATAPAPVPTFTVYPVPPPPHFQTEADHAKPKPLLLAKKPVSSSPF
jgi:hypothetical protein